MDTLMIIVILTFIPMPGTSKVGINYEAKVGVTKTLENCRNIEKAFAESPDKNKKTIVICVESKEPKPEMKKQGMRVQET